VTPRPPPDDGLPEAARAVLEFWFGPPDDPGCGLPRAVWFKADAGFDHAVGTRCAALHREAAAGRLDAWATTPLGCLALVILLDQVPRNLFRGTPAAYATDAQARAHARAAVAAGLDRALGPVQRWFVYLPFEHSEALEDQRRGVALFEALPDHPERAKAIEAVRRHHEIIARFGRFPHRNAILGRPSTDAETEFLREPNSSF
jgi:uncharacterized protein (DUF924 family)